MPPAVAAVAIGYAAGAAAVGVAITGVGAAVVISAGWAVAIGAVVAAASYSLLNVKTPGAVGSPGGVGKVDSQSINLNSSSNTEPVPVVDV